MRTVLFVTAALALSPAAGAQPAQKDDGSTTVSELVVEARRATAVSGLVAEGCTMPADSEGYATRSSRPSANEEFDPPPHPSRRTGESPGTREFILRNIAAFRQGAADFDHMSDSLARLTRKLLPVEKRWIVCRGAFKTISFLHVSQDGFDDFEVDFSGAAIEWEVKPLNSHQVTDHWAARFYYPEPATRRFDALLQSMERGRPDYGRLAPGFSPVLQARWPALQRAFKAWRGPRSIVFLHREEDGALVYKVAYGDHVVLWTVAPLDVAGRITGLDYEEKA